MLANKKGENQNKNYLKIKYLYTINNQKIKMRYSKFFQYAYLVFAVLFLYDGISKWNTNTKGAYVSFALAALAVFVFFFRKKFSKKFEDRHNS